MRVMIAATRRNFLQKNPAFATRVCYDARVESTAQLKSPKGITVDEAAALLRYSPATVRRLIADRILVAWKPGGPGGRKYLIDEVSLARWQAASIARARSDAAPVQSAILQGRLPLIW